MENEAPADETLSEEAVEAVEDKAEQIASVSDENVKAAEEAAASVSEETPEIGDESELDKELEEIREYFQQELDKAKEQSEDEEAEGEGSDGGEQDEVNEEDVCLCCGEKEKMEGSDYCEDCYEAMRRYPFKWVYFLVALLAVYIAVLAVGKISDINTGWVYSYEGDVLAEAGWYTEALDKYELAQSTLYRSKVEAKMVYLHNLEVAYEQGGFGTINSYPTAVATIFKEWELNLPYMKTLKQYYMRAQEMAATIQQVNEEVFSEYSEMAVDDLPYDTIIKKVSDLENRNLHIGIDDEGNEIPDEENDEKQGEMSSSSAVYFKRTTKYDTAMLQYFAATCKRSSEEKIGYLEAVKANAPEMTWLYAGELGIEYAENGDRDKALEYADIIYKNSETDLVSYYIRALVAKKIDNDYDAAIEYCTEGNGYNENYEFYRQIAINYLLKGDYAKAQENAQLALDANQDLATISTLAFCAIANGDEEKFNEMQQIIDEHNESLDEDSTKLDFSQSVKTLMSGKKTVEQIIKQGDYDLYD